MSQQIISLCNIYNETDIREFMNFYDARFKDFSEEYRSIHGYLSMVICFAGILGNIGIVIVLSDRSMRSSINTLLIGIAGFDMSLMVVYFCYQIVILYPSVFNSYGGQLFTAVFANWSMVAHSVSLWLTVVMAFIRFMIVTKRSVHQGAWNSQSMACIAIICTTVAVTIASILNMARNKAIEPVLFFAKFGQIVGYEVFWNSTDQGRQEPRMAYTIYFPEWWDCSMEKLNFWITGLSLKIVPCILLTLVMALLIKEIISAGQRRARLMGNKAVNHPNHTNNNATNKNRWRLMKLKSFTENTGQEKTDRITTVLLSIVIIFWLTEMPQGIMYILTAIEPATFYVYQHLGDMIDLLSLLNSCVNFVLYCAMSTVFRQRFMNTFCAWSRATGTRAHTCHTNVPAVAATRLEKLQTRTDTLAICDNNITKTVLVGNGDEDENQLTEHTFEL